MNLSSDSDDDCYSNVAKRLESLKQEYKDDKIESTDLLDNSADTSLQIHSINKTKEKNKSVITNTCSVSDDEDSLELNKLLELHTYSRVTRSKRKSNINSSITDSDLNNTITKRTLKRGKQGSRKSCRNSTIIINDDRTPPPARGRGRRKRNTRNSGISNDLPIYSVGNTSTYKDMSKSQTLFSNKTNNEDVLILEDCDTTLDNEELPVKIYWQSSEFFKFSIRKFQNFNTIFKHFSEKENVAQEKLLFTYNDKIIKPDDSPDSINYNIVKFIDGGIINRAVTELLTSDGKKQGSGINLKFQWKKLKKPVEITLQANEKLLVAMIKCAEHLDMPLSRLKFEFDGDSILGTMTPRDLDLEGGECIDVKIIS